VDDAVAKSGPLDLALVGKTIYIKFTSFNIYSAAEQSLAEVTEYPYTITGAMVSLAPSAPTGVSVSLEPFGIRVSCAANPEPDVKRYEYRVGANWATAAVLTTDGGTYFLWGVQATGAYTLWVAAVDAFGNYSAPTSVATTVASASIAGLQSSLVGTDMIASWQGVQGTFAIAGYEIRQGATWATATVVGFRQVTTYQETVFWVGARTFWVAAVDVKGNYGAPQSIVATVGAPSAVTGIYAKVIDNNALIYWTAPAVLAGQLPIDRYEMRTGASWAAGVPIGSNGNSTFTTVFEQVAGTYTYWCAAVDTAGNYGPAVSVVAYVNQPPDYILRANVDSTFGGTKVNAMPFGTGLLVPVNTSETWAQHFTSRGWASPQDQINAGFPLYLSPSATSASYTEAIDYGTTLPATNITATLNASLLAGTVGISCQIRWSNTSAAGPWTDATAGATSAVASNFRWVQVVYTFTATAGVNLLQVNGLNVKLSIKQRKDGGSGTAAVGGTFVPFNYPFIAADCPMVQPSFTSGAAPRYAVVTYAGGVNPTGFTVQIFNASGTDVGGAFSWSGGGY
jgi:hypothetical protein